MSVLSAYFDKSVNQCSPTHEDFSRVVKCDENGNEFISYVPVDYPSLVVSRGKVYDWSLDSLLKAGVNPDFPIHTSNPTRLAGFVSLGEFEREAVSILSESNPENAD